MTPTACLSPATRRAGLCRIARIPARPGATGSLLALALAACLPGVAAAHPGTCSDNVLDGRYVFTATGFTRAPASPPGTPWVPKAILEVLQFDGHGGVLTPAVTVANPFGDTGLSVQGAGAPGTYAVHPDCTGTIAFNDPNHVSFAIEVDRRGTVLRMIQTNPSNNVFEGLAVRHH